MPKTSTMALGLFIGIFTYLLPAIVLYFAVRLIMKAYLKNGERKREAEINSARNQMVLPLKLQACERLILLLERITPAQAVNRALQPGMTSYELQITLLRNIREEYEHNVAQQLYVSPSCWALIKTAKEEVIHLVNISATESEEGSTANVLAKNLLEHWSEFENDPIQSAINKLKLEAF